MVTTLLGMNQVRIHIPGTCLLLSFLLSSCISYSSATDVHNQAVDNPELLMEIELGETTSDWLVQQFGKPDAIRRPSDSVYLWQYENVQSSQRHIKAMPILAIHTKRLARTVFNFEVENDRIVKFWTESLQN